MQYPWCCYCGGATPAVTIDHVPARISFWEKQRPPGLEVPACKSCNHGAALLEQVGAVFARISAQDDRTPEQREEFRNLCAAVGRSFPGWQRELFPSSEQVKKATEKFGDAAASVKAVNVGPLTVEAISTLGSKLAFALHYKHTGKIVPINGYAEVFFETNVSMHDRELPANLVAELGAVHTLKQGSWTSDGHFAYRGAWIPDGTGSVFVCHLGKAFMLILFVCAFEEATKVEPRKSRRFNPGDLQQADAKAMTRYRLVLPVTSLSEPMAGKLGFW